jgi:uncharacterized membrane protein YfcA
MAMNNIIVYILLGLAAGTVSGLIGVGGGIVVVPILCLMGWTQHRAQGTTLAMLIPPIGILAVYTYYQRGYVDLKTAALLCLGFFFGGLVGARVATVLPDVMLRKVFGVAMLIVALRMIFQA